LGFILDPRGEVILQHYKVSPLFPVEHSICPHDVYDWWVQKYGRTLQAYWPVVDTDIGRLGIMMAREGSYPENARALALNGAEVVYRASTRILRRETIISKFKAGRGRSTTIFT
jgi:predicted amidohydrolase